MKFYSGKRIGQSWRELRSAISFSFFLHLIFFLAAFLFYSITPRKLAPPFYSVKLVGLPSEEAVVQTPASKPEPVEQKQPVKPAKPEQKEKKPAQKRASEKKDDLAGLAAVKPEQEKPETRDVEPPEKQQSTPAGGPTESAAGTEGVAVGTSQQDFKYAWYLARVRDKISRNWNPPADTREARCRVIFTVNRSGWVGAVELVDDQSAGRFEFKQAAVRAIRASNPFPPLPDGFSKQFLEFTVDLRAKE